MPFFPYNSRRLVFFDRGGNWAQVWLNGLPVSSSWLVAELQGSDSGHLPMGTGQNWSEQRPQVSWSPSPKYLPLDHKAFCPSAYYSKFWFLHIFTDGLKFVLRVSGYPWGFPHCPWLPGSSPSRIQGNPQDERRRQMRERVRQSSGLRLKFIFARPLYTLNNIFLGGSAYCLHTGHLKTLQQLDLQQKQDVTHILFCSQESFLSFGLKPANVLWLAPGVPSATSVASPVFLIINLFSF